MNRTNDFKKGDTVVYIPTHANGDKYHKDCEHGFVTSTTDKTVFCKFYWKDGSLRNKANSEGCNRRDLVKE